MNRAPEKARQPLPAGDSRQGRAAPRIEPRAPRDQINDQIAAVLDPLANAAEADRSTPSPPMVRNTWRRVPQQDLPDRRGRARDRDPRGSPLVGRAVDRRMVTTGERRMRDPALDAVPQRRHTPAAAQGEMRAYGAARIEVPDSHAFGRCRPVDGARGIDRRVVLRVGAPREHRHDPGFDESETADRRCRCRGTAGSRPRRPGSAPLG